MSKTCIQNVAVVLSLLATFPQMGQAQDYCAPKESSGWETAFKLGFQNLAEDWIRLERDLQTSHTAFFVRTGTASLSAKPQQTIWNQLESKRHELRDLYQKTRSTAAGLPAEGQAQMARFVVKYVELSQNLLYQQLAVWPFSNIDMAALQAAYEIKIPADLFAVIQKELTPLLSSLVLQETGGQITLRLSKSEILALGIRALASSPIALRQANKAYGQTIRCLMARETAFLQVRNEIRLGNQNPNANTFTKPICRGLSLRDMVAFEVPSQMIPWKIAALKENLVAAVPTYNKFIKDQVVANAIENEVTFHGQKFVVNTDPAYVYLYATQDDFKDVNIDKIRTTVQNAVIDVSESNKKLAALYDFTHTQQILAELQKITSRCGLNIDADTFANEMSEAETVYTLDSYDRSLQQAIPLHNDDSNPKQFLRRVFFQQKIDSLTKAFKLVAMAHLPQDSSVDLDQLIQDFTAKAIYPAVMYLTFKSSTDIKALDDLALSLTPTQNVTSLGLQQKDFSDRLAAAAAQARKVMNPATPLTELPYVRSIIWDYYSKDIEGISRLSKKRIQAIGKTGDTEELKAIFGKVRTSLNNELAQLGYHPNTNVAARTFNYLKSFIVSEDPNKVRAEALRKDIDLLDQMSFRLGFNGATTARQSLQDAIDDQRLGSGDLQKFIDHYRKALLAMQIGEFRILDMPVKGPGRINHGQPRPLYLALNTSVEATKNFYVQTALQQVRENLQTHLARINNAVSILDMKPYIMNSDLLQVTLGLGDLGSAIAANDVLRVANLGQIPSFTLNQDVFGPLLDLHYKYSSAWQREKNLNDAVWDEVFSSALIGTTPFIYGWMTKLGFAYVMPAKLGGRAIPGAINSAYQKTIGQWGHYWNFIYSLVGIDVAMSAYKLHSIHQELGLLDEFTYTDSEKRSLLFSNSYLSRKIYLDSRANAEMMRIGHNAFWIAFPYLTQAAITKVIQPLQAKRIGRQETLLAEAANGANTATHLKTQANVQRDAVRKFEVLSRYLHYEFKALGVADGTFAISKLQQGLREARQSKDVFRYMRAKQAYERIVRSTTETLIPYVGAQHVGDAYIRASVGSVEEYNAMVNVYNRLIQLEAKRRGAA